MKALVVVIVLLLVGIAGFGFYRGWFRLSTDNTDNKINTTITVDKEKIHADEKTAKEKVQSFGRKAEKETDQQAEKEPASQP